MSVGIRKPPFPFEPLVSSERDWTEDFEHENGNYVCRCHKCQKIFFGHKRRVTCKVCAAA